MTNGERYAIRELAKMLLMRDDAPHLSGVAYRAAEDDLTGDLTEGVRLVYGAWLRVRQTGPDGPEHGLSAAGGLNDAADERAPEPVPSAPATVATGEEPGRPPPSDRCDSVIHLSLAPGVDVRCGKRAGHSGTHAWPSRLGDESELHAEPERHG